MFSRYMYLQLFQWMDFHVSLLISREYMLRSFEACVNEDDKSQVERYLKIEINEMFRDKRVWQIDWSSEPLPL